VNPNWAPFCRGGDELKCADSGIDANIPKQAKLKRRDVKPRLADNCNVSRTPKAVGSRAATVRPERAEPDGEDVGPRRASERNDGKNSG
jgi:hypothetical protein